MPRRRRRHGAVSGQLVVRATGGNPRRGSAQTVDIGRTETVGGCDPGTVSFGSPDDPGIASGALDMAYRPPMDDLRPGTTLAGMSEAPYIPAGDATEEYMLPPQVAWWGAGTVTFQSTGHIYATYPQGSRFRTSAATTS